MREARREAEVRDLSDCLLQSALLELRNSLKKHIFVSLRYASRCLSPSHSSLLLFPTNPLLLSSSLTSPPGYSSSLPAPTVTIVVTSLDLILKQNRNRTLLKFAQRLCCDSGLKFLSTDGSKCTPMTPPHYFHNTHQQQQQ